MNQNKSNKPKVIKDFEKLDEQMQELVRQAYPNGFSEHIIRFTNKDGKYISAVPYETEDRYYLVKVTVAPPKKVAKEEDDYEGDDGGDEEKEQSNKYADLDTIAIHRKQDDHDEGYD